MRRVCSRSRFGEWGRGSDGFPPARRHASWSNRPGDSNRAISVAYTLSLSRKKCIGHSRRRASRLSELSLRSREDSGMNLRQFTGVGVGISVGLCFALLLASEGGPTDYTAAIEKWRQDRETRLKADDGWLTVAGLFWLKGGGERFGTDPPGGIRLAPRSGP